MVNGSAPPPASSSSGNLHEQLSPPLQQAVTTKKLYQAWPVSSSNSAASHQHRSSLPSPPLPSTLSADLSLLTCCARSALQARSHPICRGSCLLGVHWMNLLFNISLTLTLVVLFCVYTAARLHWSLILVAAVLTAVTEAALLAAALSDPGIIPRAVPNDDETRKRKAFEELRDRRGTAETRRMIGLPPELPPPPPASGAAGQQQQRSGDEQQQVFSNESGRAPSSSTSHVISIPAASSPSAHSSAATYLIPTQRVRSFDAGTGRPRVTEVPLKYCTTCHVYRPYQASHCRECDVCIRQFDHHCPWISNCVGERNHRYFLLFILSLTVLTVFVFVVSLYDLVSAGITDALSTSLSSHLVALVECVFCFIVGLCFLSLSSYQLWLIAENTTTNAHIKAGREERQRHADIAYERHVQYAMRMRGDTGQSQQQPAAAAGGGQQAGATEAQEAAIGVVSGSALTAGTLDEREEKAQAAGGWQAGSQAAASNAAASDDAGKTFPYPDVDAVVASSSIAAAYWQFFCSPQPSSLDLQSEVQVDASGKIVAYNAPPSQQ